MKVLLELSEEQARLVADCLREHARLLPLLDQNRDYLGRLAAEIERLAAHSDCQIDWEDVWFRPRISDYT
jgi:hypothetical protein